MPLSDGFILTSNRDEKKERQADFPKTYPSKTGTVTFPKDALAGGTWFAVSETKMICLLNGAFEKHQPKPPYRHSRGKVVLDAFDCLNFEHFRSTYNYHNIEPHTLVMIDFEAEIELVEMRWDGLKKHIKPLDSRTAHIWSSCTLYAPEIISEREKWFADFVSSNRYEMEQIKNFHKTGGSGDPKNDLLMKRTAELKTISITSFEFRGGQSQFVHENLLENKIIELAP